MLHSTYGGKDVEKKHYAEARSAISWVRKLKKGDMSNNYLQNLQIICKSGRVSKKNLGFAVSLISAYQSHLRDEARRKAYEESHANEMMSEYVENLVTRLMLLSNLEYFRQLYQMSSYNVSL